MIVAGGNDGLLRFWDVQSGRPLWMQKAHKSYVVGIHYESDDIVMRGFGGEVSRWTVPKLGRLIETCETSDRALANQRACGIVRQ